MLFLEVGVGYNTLRKRTVKRVEVFYVKIKDSDNEYQYVKYYLGKDLINMGIKRRNIRNFSPMNESMARISPKVIDEVVKELLYKHGRPYRPSKHSGLGRQSAMAVKQTLVRVTDAEAVILTAFFYKLQALCTRE